MKRIRAKKAPLISIVIPVYNELPNISLLCTRLLRVCKQSGYSAECIFVDDHSTDGTSQALEKLSKNKIARITRKKGKKGKAYSLIEGFSLARGSYIVMIDADLQYPPEEIPHMIKLLEKADIVVANRKTYTASLLRQLMTFAFKKFFGSWLFHLEHDVQSGLKVFTREVMETIRFTPSSGWTFDLEFLHRANQAGFRIVNHDIIFSPRVQGESKIHTVRSACEIAVNAFRTRVKRVHPIVLAKKEKNLSMIGAGIRHKKHMYITHTTLPYPISALDTFVFHQKILLVSLVCAVIVGLLFMPLITLSILIGLLSTVYFLDVLFNLFVVFKSLYVPQELAVSQLQLDGIEKKNLPMYSILCPLYKEAHIIPQFLQAIDRISWPKQKLDVLLLLEEDDIHTIDAVKQMRLPSYVRVVIVPDSQPKTKPKACNYGLSKAKGKFLVIYDAEDVPDPLQLKKAYCIFQRVEKNIICLQAKLNYFNPYQNLLTRFFTAEYSLWFDVTLTGLQSIETSLPLGGTSNHFVTNILRELKGWDPFNVTEDADLGVRLFNAGYRTAMMDSTTYEEANSKVPNWIRQRSRWIKGYMQTYLVHTRSIHISSWSDMLHSFYFQMTVGGKIAFILINPLLWLATISYFTLYWLVGPAIEKLYPSVVFYMALISLVFGNFMFVYYYMIGCIRREQYRLIKYVFFIPAYWILISWAGFVALYQLFFKPHYWEKTVHGFSKQPGEQTLVSETVIKIEKRQGFFFLNKDLQNIRVSLSKKQIEGGIFILATGLGSVFNFLYSAYLGRVLSLEDFALISFIAGLSSLVSFVASSFGATVSYKSGFLMGQHGDGAGLVFWKYIRSKVLLLSLGVTAVWFVVSPFLVQYFQLSSISPFLIFSPILLVMLAYSADRGYLSSRLSFGLLGGLYLLEPVIKFGIAVALVGLGLTAWTYAAIPFSIFFAFLLGWLVILKTSSPTVEQVHQDTKSFPRSFFLASLISGFSYVLFLNLDVVLAKHYLSPTSAGMYSLSALIAKIIYFLGAFASPFVFPLVSRNEGAKSDSKRVLYLTLLGTLAFALPGVIGFGFLGRWVAPFLFGAKTTPILSYLLPLSLGMLGFTIARVFGDYYLAKKQYTFAAAGLLIGILQIFLLAMFHQTVASFVYVMSFVWVLYMGATIVLHMFSNNVRTFENNVKDFLGLFGQLRQPKIHHEGKYRILIFNWRDTKHKWGGGAEVYIQEIAKRWVRDGNHVTLFCGNDRQHPRSETVHGVHVVRRGGFYTVYLWAILYYLFRFNGQYDVIIDSENGIPFFTPLYTKLPTFLLIHHVHQEVFRKSLRWPFSFVARYLEVKVMPFVYQRIRVITVSPSSQKEIMQHKLTQNKPDIVYNGVDMQVYMPGKKERTPLIIYVGRLKLYKSIHILLYAHKKVVEKIPKAVLVIAGDGEDRTRLEKLKKKLGLGESVRFVGKISQEEKVVLYQRAWVFVNPSFMEGWGITTIEANACGTPVIASDVPGLRDSIRDKHTGFLVKYADVDGLSTMIRILIKKTDIRKRMEKEAVLWASTFDWETSAMRLYQIIDEHIAHRAAEHESGSYAFTQAKQYEK